MRVGTGNHDGKHYYWLIHAPQTYIMPNLDHRISITRRATPLTWTCQNTNTPARLDLVVAEQTTREYTAETDYHL